MNYLVEVMKIIEGGMKRDEKLRDFIRSRINELKQAFSNDLKSGDRRCQLSEI